VVVARASSGLDGRHDDQALAPRAQGLALSWVGSGRLIFSLNYTEADFEAVADRFVAAARAMQQDDFWWTSPALTNKSIKRRLLREMLAASSMRSR